MNRLKKSWIIFVLILFIEIICYPIAVIWSLNKLFGLGIQLTWKTFMASFILTHLLRNDRWK